MHCILSTDNSNWNYIASFHEPFSQLMEWHMFINTYITGENKSRETCANWINSTSLTTVAFFIHSITVKNTPLSLSSHKTHARYVSLPSFLLLFEDRPGWQRLNGGFYILNEFSAMQPTVLKYWRKFKHRQWPLVSSSLDSPTTDRRTLHPLHRLSDVRMFSPFCCKCFDTVGLRAWRVPGK